MIHTDENALICDMAETYHIYDYRQLRPTQAAVFAFGLPDDSRIKRKMSGQRFGVDTLLLASIADSLRTLIWFQTADGHSGTNRPESILDRMTGVKADDDVEAYDTIEAYEAARQRLLET